MFRRMSMMFAMSYAVVSYASHTVLNLYRPFVDNPLKSAWNIKGRCLEQSQRIQREDAWRCVSDEGAIHDPCFSKRFGSDNLVFCSTSPWSKKGEYMVLGTPLDSRHQQPLDMSRTLPWAIELTNGERCLSIDSQASYEGLPVHYVCTNEVNLLGDAHRCAQTWTILRHDYHSVSQVDISKVWF